MQFDKTLRTAESSHNPESPSEEGEKLRRTTLSVLVMTILDDQICYVMFTGKNNGVLPFERNRSILQATSCPQYFFRDERV